MITYIQPAWIYIQPIKKTIEEKEVYKLMGSVVEWIVIMKNNKKLLSKNYVTAGFLQQNDMEINTNDTVLLELKTFI